MIQYFNIALPQHRIAHCLDITLLQKYGIYIDITFPLHHITSTICDLNVALPGHRSAAPNVALRIHVWCLARFGCIKVE